MESEKAPNAAATTVDASRVRLMLEGGRTFALSGTATLRPSLERGVNHDGGDAEIGTGVELGVVAYTGGATGLSVEAMARMLVEHAASDYLEWGRCLSFSLLPTIGAMSTASERLWGAPNPRAFAPASEAGSGFEAARGLRAEAGYGHALFGDRFTSPPNPGFGMSDGGTRDYRVGWWLTSVVRGDPSFEIDVDAIQREATDGNASPEHGVMLRRLIRW